MNEFALRMLENFTGTLAGGLITILIINKQIRAHNKMKMANDLIEDLDFISDKVASIKYQIIQSINTYIDTGKINEKYLVIENDILSYMRDLSRAFIKVSKSFKKNERLLENFDLSYSDIIEQYEQLSNQLYNSLKAIEGSGYDQANLKLKRDTISTIVNSMIFNIKSLENDIQDKYYYRIKDRKIVKIFKKNREERQY